MIQPSPLALPDAWNLVAESYVTDLVPLFEQYARDAIALADLPPEAHVLDVAAGPGTLALQVAPRAARVVAVDFAEAMVDALRRRASERGVAHVVETRVGDGQALPFSDGEFDGAFSMFGLMFFPDRAAGFRELHRVLRPGRRAVVSSWAPMDKVPLLATLFGTLRELLPDLPRGPSNLPLADADEFRAEMSAAGFRDVVVHAVAHPLTAPSARAFWASNARSSAPLVLVRKNLDAATWQAVGEGICARLEREFGTGPITGEWPARLGVGSK